MHLICWRKLPTGLPPVSDESPTFFSNVSFRVNLIGIPHVSAKTPVPSDQCLLLFSCHLLLHLN